MIFQQMNFLCPFENMILELSIYNFFFKLPQKFGILQLASAQHPQNPKSGHGHWSEDTDNPSDGLGGCPGNTLMQ